MLLFILQTKWSQPSDQCTLPLTFYSQHLLLDSLGFWQVIWLEKYSVSPLELLEEPQHPLVVLFIHFPNLLTPAQGHMELEAYPSPIQHLYYYLLLLLVLLHY